MTNAMDILVLSMAALAALAPSVPPTVASAGAFSSNHAAASVARRRPGGATATATVSVRIISTSAQVGAGFAPPLPGMTPRPATIAAADGRPVAALIYDFE